MKWLVPLLLFVIVLELGVIALRLPISLVAGSQLTSTRFRQADVTRIDDPETQVVCYKVTGPQWDTGISCVRK